MNCNQVYRCVLSAAICAAFVIHVQAADGTWLGTQDNVWVNNANWTGSTYPGSGFAQTATFNSGGNGNTVLDLLGLSVIRNIAFETGDVAAYTLGTGGPNAQTLVLDTSSLLSVDSSVSATQRVDAAIQLHTTTSWSQHNFKNDSLSYPLVLNGNIAGAPSGGTPSTKAISVDGDGDIVIGGNISAGGANAAQLKKNGQGKLTLAGDNTFGVDSEYYGGTIRLTHPQAYTGMGKLLIRTPPPGGIIEFAHDESNETPFDFAAGVINTVGNTATLVSGVGTGSTGRNYTLGTLGISGTSISVARSDQVTSGTPSITIQTVDLNGSGTVCTLFPSTADLYVGNITISANSQHKTIVLDGTAAGSRVDGVISNGTHTVSVVKSNSGTWTLLGANVYTGTTSVAGGTLALAGSDGSIRTTDSLSVTGGTLLLDNSAGANTDRLPDTVPISLAAATLQFTHAGGAANYSESGGSLTVKSGSVTVSASRADEGQTSTLTFSELVYEGGTVDFTGEGLGEDTRNRIIFTNPPALVGGAIGPWATVNGTALATYGPNGVTAYTPGSTTDIAARGPASVIPDDAAAHVRIVDDGTDGPITLAEDDTGVAALTQANSDHAATVDTAGKTLRAAAVAVENGAAALTVGADVGDGTLTALSAGGVLSLINNSENPLTVNADVADNGTASLLSALGNGAVVLRGEILHTGDIAVNSGSLVLDRAVDQVVSNKISGTGALVKDGTNYMHLLGENTYTGPTYINAGIVRANADTTFGTPDGGVFIADGATLDIGCTEDVGGTRLIDQLYFGTQLFTVSGAGADGNGVIVNTSATRQLNALSKITLAGDTSIGGPGYLRMRNYDPTLTLNGYTLTKIGPETFDFYDVNFIPGDGHIDVAEGTFMLLYNTRMNGSAANTVTVRSGATLQFTNFAQENAPVWSIICENDAILRVSNGASGYNAWAGPVTLQGAVTVTAGGSYVHQFSGEISGAGPVNKLSSAWVYFHGTNNTYTGQTIINAGRIVTTSLRNVGEACSLGQPMNAADAAILIGSGSTGGGLDYIGAGDETDRRVTMNGTSGSVTLYQNGSGTLKYTSDLDIATAGNKTLVFRGAGSAPGEFAGKITDVGGNVVTVTKTDSGVWELSGTNDFTGTLSANGGTLVLSGSNTLNYISVSGGRLDVGGYLNQPGGSSCYVTSGTSDNGVLRVGAGGFMTGTGNFSAGRNTDSCGALYIDGGTFIRNTASDTGERFNFGGYSLPGYGYLKVSDGLLKATRFVLGAYNSTAGLGMGVGRITGGVFETKNGFFIGFNPYSLGVLTVEGGTIDHANASTFIQMGYAGGRGELNMTGGTLLNDGHVIEMRRSSGNTTSIVNICSGTLSLNAFENRAPGIGWINLRGGTLRATANTSVFFPTTLTAVYSFGAAGDFAGGAMIDTDGFNIAFAKPVSAPTGNGVYAVTLTDGGSGYIGEPYVSITGGGGFGVAAVANMQDDGTGNGTYRVASVTITAPGCNYTSTPTVAFLRGGNGVTEPTVAGVTLAPNVSGGLTKTGAGTLTLNAVNTYQGVTKVSGGTILLTNDKALPTGTAVVLDGGTLDLNGYTVTNTVSGSGTLANGTLQTVISPAGAGVIGSETITLNGAALAGTYLADVAADGTSDHVTIDGSIDLDSMTLEIVDPLLLDRDQEYTIMAVTGLVTGKMTGTNLPDSRWKVVGSGGVVKLRFVDGLVIKVK